jgi:hypothetical protein
VLPVAHRTLSGAQANASMKWQLSGFSASRSAIIHWTVRCAPDMSGEPIEQRPTAPNGRLRCHMNSEQCASQKSEQRSQNTPDCPVPQEDKRLQRSTAPNPNGLLTWHALDSEQCHVRCTTRLSGVPIDSNGWNSGWGYKYPQPPPFKPSKFSELHIQYKSKSIHSKTHSKDQILSKPQNQLNCLVT